MPRPSLAEGRGSPRFRLGTLCERDEVSAILAGRTRQSRDPQRGREICPRGENLPPSGVDSPKVPPAQRGRAARTARCQLSGGALVACGLGSLHGCWQGRQGRGICPRGENLPPSGVDLQKVPPAGKGEWGAGSGEQGAGSRAGRQRAAGKRSRSRQQRERAARATPPSAFRRDVPRGGQRRGRLPRSALRRRRVR